MSFVYRGYGTLLARVCEKKNCLSDAMCECVCKLFGLTKDKVQKDAKNREILCSTSFT